MPMDRPGNTPPPADPAICARCATAGPTCCELTPGHEDQCFPVSEMERARIVEATDLALGALTPQANTAAFLASMHRLFPRERAEVDALFPASGRHLRLSVTASGRCVFLRAEGCGLPRAARPYYCRLFPFWMASGRVSAFAATGCLVHRQGRTVAGMLALLDMTEARVRHLHGRLRLAWGLPPREGMPVVIPPPARFGT